MGLFTADTSDFAESMLKPVSHVTTCPERDLMRLEIHMLPRYRNNVSSSLAQDIDARLLQTPQTACRSITISLIVLLILRTRLLTLPNAIISFSGMLKGKG